MALWGNNDNVAYLYNGAVGDTVTVDYDNLTVTGTGTTWGTAGFAKTGDVIRIGFRGTGGTYFGDATIVGIASTTQLSIASTDGLSGAAIAGTSYWISELPQYTTLNPNWSEDSTFNDGAPTYTTIWTGTATTSVGVGNSIIPIDSDTVLAVEHRRILVKNFGDPTYTGPSDVFLNDGNEIPIVSIGTAFVTASQASGVGSDRIYVNTGDDDGLPNPGANDDGEIYQINGLTDWQSYTVTVTSLGSTYVGLGTTIATAVSANEQLVFEAITLGIMGIANTISAGIGTDDALTFQRPLGGKSSIVVGISTDGVGAARSTQAETSAGWVGVTTYMGVEGEMRVKKEVLVAMSGIETGPAGAAGTAGKAFPPAWATDLSV